VASLLVGVSALAVFLAGRMTCLTKVPSGLRPTVFGYVANGRKAGSQDNLVPVDHSINLGKSSESPIFEQTR